MTTFETAAREHIASRSTKDTRMVYSGDLNKWLVFCEQEKIEPSNPPFVAAIKFRERLTASFSKATVRRVLAMLSGCYRAAGLANPFEPKRLPRPPADAIGVTQAFSIEEVKALFGATQTDRERTIMQLLFGTGLRISEVLAIRRDALHQQEDRIVLISVVKKKGRVETVLPPHLKLAVEQWLSKAPSSIWLFPGRNPKQHVTASWFRAQLKTIAERASVTRAHPHRFRATFITEAIDAGIPLHEVQAAVHHSSPATTLRYDRGVRGTGVTTTLAEFRNKK